MHPLSHTPYKCAVPHVPSLAVDVLYNGIDLYVPSIYFIKQ